VILQKYSFYWRASWWRSSNKPSVHFGHQPSDWKRYWYLTSISCSKNFPSSKSNSVSNLAICLCVIEWNFWLSALNGCIILVNWRNSQPHSHPLCKGEQKANNLANVMDEGPPVPHIGPKPVPYLVSYIFPYDGSVCSPEMLEKRTRSDNYCQNWGSSPGSHTSDWPLCAVFVSLMILPL